MSYKIDVSCYAFLSCDFCGKVTNMRGSYDTPLKIMCEECARKKGFIR